MGDTCLDWSPWLNISEIVCIWYSGWLWLRTSASDLSVYCRLNSILIHLYCSCVSADTEMRFGGLISTSNIVTGEIVTVESDSDLLWTISIKKAWSLVGVYDFKTLHSTLYMLDDRWLPAWGVSYLIHCSSMFTLISILYRAAIGANLVEKNLHLLLNGGYNR